ncbi:MAG TPA: 4-hydroxy-tetrahydrodipicolinate reductase [Puia sp.]|jgi:4-hydroxy-tetrahydrodipicolinate reductase|nr:4-hydroxy-tetrahydrodipicolinate reductase [Puia sp.]
MRIVLIGYGKMGKAIERVAVARGHEVVLKIDLDNSIEMTRENLSKADLAIEFTGPSSAAANLLKCAEAGIRVVCGSTGWLEKYSDVKQAFEKKGSAFLYASNFSIGVNIFFELNKKLASLMVPFPEYTVEMREIHHTQKKDAPSGTAITLAEQILDKIPSLKTWVNRPPEQAGELPILSERLDPAPGTHIVKYYSSIDDIEIIHTAHNREGFAGGAVLAAEFIQNKKGIFSMNDVLGF